VSVLIVPTIEDRGWPTLGYQVADWIESNLVFGPGDLRGEPAKVDDEKRGLLARAYEVYPKDYEDKSQRGRRRFRRVGVSVRKGWAKTEWGAWVAAAELHPDAPVRVVDWGVHGDPNEPIGIGVTDPYVPLVAYTVEQSDELAYGALRVILQYSRVADDFDIGIERIMRKGGDGKAVSLSTAPDARDGARTTFQLFDETHRFTLPRLKQAHRTMLANLPKRKLSDAWALEITTAPAPGEGSVAEDTMEYARKVADGSASDARLFFFHRQASDGHDLTTKAGIRAAVVEASGPAAAWSDVDGICEQWDDPTADRAYLERVWLNRLVRASDRAFDANKWRENARPDFTVPEGSLITLGFDGARYHDSTAIVATHIESGYQWIVGLWERPLNVENWEVPVADVTAALDGVMKRYDVWRAYCDPPYWESHVSDWAGKYGSDRVMEWWTNRFKPMAYAIRSYSGAILAGEVTHSGDRAFTRHVGNACRRYLTLKDEDGKPLWVMQKERPDSPHKIDACMAGCLSWEARNDAIAAGVIANGDTVYKDRGVLVF
jgi:hypothetical protein